MPVNIMPGLRLPKPNRDAVLDFMPGSDVPVIRQPFKSADPLPFWSMGMRVDDHHCYDLSVDPDELENRLGSQDEADMIELLRVALRAIDAPEDQFERLGIR